MDGTPVVRMALRLLLLAGAAITAFLVLALLDRPAHADLGIIEAGDGGGGPVGALTDVVATVPSALTGSAPAKPAPPPETVSDEPPGAARDGAGKDREVTDDAGKHGVDEADAGEDASEAATGEVASAGGSEPARSPVRRLAGATSDTVGGTPADEAPSAASREHADLAPDTPAREQIGGTRNETSDAAGLTRLVPTTPGGAVPAPATGGGAAPAPTVDAVPLGPLGERATSTVATTPVDLVRQSVTGAVETVPSGSVGQSATGVVETVPLGPVGQGVTGVVDTTPLGQLGLGVTSTAKTTPLSPVAETAAGAATGAVGAVSLGPVVGTTLGAVIGAVEAVPLGPVVGAVAGVVEAVPLGPVVRAVIGAVEVVPLGPVVGIVTGTVETVVGIVTGTVETVVGATGVVVDTVTSGVLAGAIAAVIEVRPLATGVLAPTMAVEPDPTTLEPPVAAPAESELAPLTTQVPAPATAAPVSATAAYPMVGPRKALASRADVAARTATAAAAVGAVHDPAPMGGFGGCMPAGCAQTSGAITAPSQPSALPGEPPAKPYARGHLGAPPASLIYAGQLPRVDPLPG